MIVRYIGLARSLFGVDEEVITEDVKSLKSVIAILRARHTDVIEDALRSNGQTYLGHLMIELEGKSVDLRDASEIPLRTSSELSVMIIPTVVGG